MRGLGVLQILGEAKPPLKAHGAAPKPSGSLSPGQGTSLPLCSLFFEGTGDWAASGLCEILVVTFALFPLPPALFLGIEGGGREGEETKVICHLLTTTFSILGHARKKHF